MQRDRSPKHIQKSSSKSKVQTLSIGKHGQRSNDWQPWNRSDWNITLGTMILNPDFREFFQLLNANDVHYLIVGGYAVAFHGYPRYTKDIDVWIWINLENAKKVIKSLKDFGFESLGLETRDFLEAETVIQLGHAPNRIDLMTSLEGLDFATCYRHKVEETFHEIRITFIDLEHLKESKRLAGRYQDLADIENLTA